MTAVPKVTPSAVEKITFLVLALPREATKKPQIVFRSGMDFGVEGTCPVD